MYSYPNKYTPTWPDFEVTIIHNREGIEYIRATIEGRLCNLAFKDASYIAGGLPPRYPLPVDIGHVSLGDTYPGVVYVNNADEDNPEMVWYYEKPVSRWKQMFPEGRFIFYEGHKPEGFIAEIKQRFGFDPVEGNLGWSKEFKEYKSFGFFCPPEHLDAICTEYPIDS